jgi:hypothetical protein
VTQCNETLLLHCDHSAVLTLKEKIMELVILSGIAAIAVITVELLDYAR